MAITVKVAEEKNCQQCAKNQRKLNDK